MGSRTGATEIPRAFSSRFQRARLRLQVIRKQAQLIFLGRLEGSIQLPGVVVAAGVAFGLGCLLLLVQHFPSKRIFEVGNRLITVDLHQHLARPKAPLPDARVPVSPDDLLQFADLDELRVQPRLLRRRQRGAIALFGGAQHALASQRDRNADGAE